MWKYILGVLLLVGLVGGYFGYEKYQIYFMPSVPTNLKNEYVHIPTQSTFEEVKDILLDNNFITNGDAFEEVAIQMNYKRDNMRAGRFKIKGEWSHYDLVRHLRGGMPSTVKVILNNERLPEDVASKVAGFIEADSASIYRLLTNELFLQEKGYKREEVMSVFIPNTYDFYWNTSAKQFFEKMEQEHDKFWNKNNRREKAKEMKMTEKEVYTLASIVERETLKNDEKVRIAGVYLNRLEKGMLLQADPTVVFAVGEFGLRRVLNRHLEFDSPYNTYKYTGLPPGPISMASIASIDGVLNAEDHKYLYFCAKPDLSGYHTFAKSLAAHNVNARKYHRWLNSQKR